MSDIKETLIASESPGSTEGLAAEPKQKKRKILSLPFLAFIALLAVGGYFGVKQIMYSTMLNDLNSKEIIAPTVPAPNGEPAAPIQPSQLNM